MPEKVTLYVVSYDISENKVRKKVSDTLEDYGYRVQYSVFECRVSQLKYKEMYARLVKLVTSPGDSVRFYTICENCAAKIRTIGVKIDRPEDEDVIII